LRVGDLLRPAVRVGDNRLHFDPTADYAGANSSREPCSDDLPTPHHPQSDPAAWVAIADKA
jgi:hypothetical protein